jgi:hypothetical protein
MPEIAATLQEGVVRLPHFWKRDHQADVFWELVPSQKIENWLDDPPQTKYSNEQVASRVHNKVIEVMNGLETYGIPYLSQVTGQAPPERR